MTSVVSPTRSDRRRERTRAKLVDAARGLFARQGVDLTRINEITEAADVGFGSFYNHFASKDEIAEVVLREALTAQANALLERTAGLEDPAAIVAAAHRHFVGIARADPEWAALLIRMDVTHNVIYSALAPFAARDIEAGVAAGRFDVPDAELALRATGGALLGVMRALLGGLADPDAEIHHAELVLRMLGLSRREAASVARRGAA